MSSPSSPSSGSNRNDAIEVLDRYFPVQVRQAYERFTTSRLATDADVVVLAIMVDYLPGKENRPTIAPADGLALVADLGFDSVSITEMVFFLEDLFEVRITNDEIMRVRTVGDLREFVRQKLSALPPAAQRA